MLPPTPGFPGFGAGKSRPTSVPGLGLLGRAFSFIFPPVEVTPIANPGSPAPRTADPTFVGLPVGLFVTGVAPGSVFGFVCTGSATAGATVVVVVVASFFFQNFHPASASPRNLIKIRMDNNGWWEQEFRVII